MAAGHQPAKYAGRWARGMRPSVKPGVYKARFTVLIGSGLGNAVSLLAAP